MSEIKINFHESAEYYILKLGYMLGFLTYTADYSKKYREKNLGDIALLKKFPQFGSKKDITLAKNIDVTWFNEKKNLTHCFEVEHTKDIVHSLDKLIQLQHLDVEFFIVVPEYIQSEYESLLNRESYTKISDRLCFISYNELTTTYTRELSWAQLRSRVLLNSII